MILRILWRLFWRQNVKVSITCPHGEFIPGLFRPGKAASFYSCDPCKVKIMLETHQGPIDW